MDENRLSDGFSVVDAFNDKLGEAVDLTDTDAHAYWQEQIVNVALSSDTFYVLMDLRTHTFSHIHGVETFFGIKELSFPYFFSQIHPAHQELFLTWGEAAYASASDPENRKILQPLKQEYRTMISLKNRAGTYYWVTQIAIPLQFDVNRNLLSHLNIYRVGIAYDMWQNWAIRGEILENNLPRKDFSLAIEEYVKQYISSIFVERIIHLLEAYALGKSTQDIAAHFGISKKTLYTHNKDILSKANGLFQKDFSTVKEAALALRERAYL
ncbi:MAG: hypothetical protein AAF696_09230 [Bacteroidota bacterium]